MSGFISDQIRWTTRDCALYAISIGVGDNSHADNTRAKSPHLRFTYERHSQFTVFPTMPLGAMFQSRMERIYETSEIREMIEFDPEGLVHGEQLVEWPEAVGFGLVDAKNQDASPKGYEWFQTNSSAKKQSAFPEYFPTNFVGSLPSKVIAILPKASGVAVFVESTLVDAHMNSILAIMTGVTFLRKATLKVPLDDLIRMDPTLNKISVLKAIQRKMNLFNMDEDISRAPQHDFTVRVRENQNLLYRLNGDLNPLHIDPAVAGRVGFAEKGPILHGLCTLGIATRFVVDRFPLRKMTMISCRFSSPVFPGDDLTISLKEIGGSQVMFSVKNASGVAVLSNGLATFAKASVGLPLKSSI